MSDAELQRLQQQALDTSDVTRDWDFVAEGNANAVFAYRGRDLTLQGQVLRLRKRKRTVAASTVDAQDASVLFTNVVLSELLPRTDVVQLIGVPISQPTLHRFADLYDVLSNTRRQTDAVDQGCSHAVLGENMLAAQTGQSALAIEIKPKWGFLPDHDERYPETSQVKSKYCRRCMHRVQQGHLELENWDSRFCPLQLFASDRKLNSSALEALWHEWSSHAHRRPYNNLRFFVNGDLVQANSKEIDTKLKGAFEKLGAPPDADTLQQFIQVCTPVLQQSKALQRLSHLQAYLDPIDIQGLHLLEPSEPNLAEPTMDELLYVAQVYSQHHESEGKRWIERLDARGHAIAYLLSASFKDCSFFVCLSPDREPSIKLVDVDLKKLKKLGEWHELDQSIVKNFISKCDAIRSNQGGHALPTPCAQSV